MMITHLEQELEGIKSKIYEIADYVIEFIAKAVKPLKEADLDLAREVLQNDSILDNLEVEIDNDCIRGLVTRQPAAVHLRLTARLITLDNVLAVEQSS